MANPHHTGLSGVNVTGMTGGKAGTSNAAHTVHGGMGNTGTHYTGGRTVNQSVRGSQGAVSLAGVEARDINIQHRAPEGRPRVGNVKSSMYGVNDISLVLRKEKFSEEVIKNVKDNGINGRYLIELTDDDMMEELGITSALGKMKLRKIIKDFTEEQGSYNSWE